MSILHNHSLNRFTKTFLQYLQSAATLIALSLPSIADPHVTIVPPNQVNALFDAFEARRSVNPTMANERFELGPGKYPGKCVGIGSQSFVTGSLEIVGSGKQSTFVTGALPITAVAELVSAEEMPGMSGVYCYDFSNMPNWPSTSMEELGMRPEVTPEMFVKPRLIFISDTNNPEPKPLLAVADEGVDNRGCYGGRGWGGFEFATQQVQPPLGELFPALNAHFAYIGQTVRVIEEVVGLNSVSGQPEWQVAPISVQNKFGGDFYVREQVGWRRVHESPVGDGVLYPTPTNPLESLPVGTKRHYFSNVQA